MSPLEYLRGLRPPLNPRQREAFLAATAAVDAEIRAARTLTPGASQDALRCPCAVIYSRCHYPAHAQMGT